MPGVPLRIIADFLDTRLQTGRSEDVPTIWRAAERPVRRLGLALEYRPDLPSDGLDALFLHRPFRLPLAAMPGVGILAAHAAFDEHLTTGYNPALAEAHGLDGLDLLERDGRVIGMVGRLAAPRPWASWEARVRQELGGLEASLPHGVVVVARAAVANAMTAPLIEDAAALHADAYVTGQLRVPGRAPAAALGVGVLAAGHRRVEAWGLNQLSGELRAAFPTLEVRVLT